MTETPTPQPQSEPAAAPATEPAPAAAPTPAVEPSAAEPPEQKGDGQYISDEIEELINHDPFSNLEKIGKGDAPASEPPAPAEGEPPVTDAPIVEAKPSVLPTDEPVKPAAPVVVKPEPIPAKPGAEAPQPVPVVDPAVAALMAEVKNLQSTITGMQAQAQPAAAVAQPKPSAYQYNVPDALVTALNSDDPAQFKAGLAGLMQGVSETVDRTVQQKLDNITSQQVPAMIEQSLQRFHYNKSVFDDFYGKNPDLNRPEVRPIIQEAARRVSAQTGITTWSEQMGTLVAQETRRIMQSFAPQQQPVVPAPVGQPIVSTTPVVNAPLPASTPAAAPTFFSGGNRIGGNDGVSGLENEVAEMLFG